MFPPPTLLRSALAAFVAFAAIPATLAAAQDPSRGTGLPLPRFVSLKSDDVNVRRGPGQDYDIAYTYVHAGLPVEITQEFDNWRKIRDSEGAEGWVFHSLLSGKRTALVAPWEPSGPFAAHLSADASAAIVAYFQPKAIVDVHLCTGTWCEIVSGAYEGWIQQDRLFGVYPDENFDD